MRTKSLLTTAAPRAFASVMITTPEAVQAAKTNGANGLQMDAMLVRSRDTASMVDYWDTVDAILDGIDGLRKAGERYLPKFTDEQDDDYKFRSKMTKLTNIFRDTIEGLSSKPFEQDVELGGDEDTDVEAPEPVADFIEDVDGSGNNLTVFAGGIFFNGIANAIHWIFVDHPPADPNVRSIADAKAAGARPYWSHVLGRNVLDPRSTVIKGVETLTYVRIMEPGPVNHIRTFERNEKGVVTWTLYEKRNDWRDVDDGYVSGKTQYFPIDEGALTIDRIPLVPFVTGRRDGRTFKVFPAMQDAADLQIELYQQESALKFVKTMAGYPMLSGNGVSPPKDAQGQPKKLAVGPGKVLYAPAGPTGEVGSWAFVEPGAQSMKFLAEECDTTKKDLRELGRQPLTAQSGNLTVITTAVAAGKAKSAVKAWAFLLKDALENAMVITDMYLGVTADQYDPIVNVYTEFDEFLDGKDLDALNTARTNKDISRETYWEEFKRRGVLGPEFNAEREEERLLKEVPGDGEDTAPGTLDPNDPEPPEPNA